MKTGTVLDRIADATRVRVARARATTAPEEMESRALAAPGPRPFAGALSRPGISVIAEVKRASPSAGPLAPDLDPAATAADYERNGAAAISVLTEPDFFDGDIAHLVAVRGRVGLPVLMKDFFVDEYQVAQARAAGADCILLIVALLSKSDLRGMLGAAKRFGLDALVEVHDEAELETAIDAGATLLGVNNRNLKTLETDLEVSRRLASKVSGDGLTLVCESGLRQPEHLAEMASLGFDAFLVGTHLVAGGRPGETLAGLLRRSRD